MMIGKKAEDHRPLRAWFTRLARGLNGGRLERWLPTLAVVLALLLRLAALGRKSVWLDEAITLRIAARDAGQIVMAHTITRLHPWLYYLFMHYWNDLGQSEFVARVPSVVFGVVGIFLLYWLVRLWAGRWSATASAWLLAIAPLHVWYSQEARMYALVCTLGLASALAFTLGVRRGSLWAWALWVVVTAAGLYTHYSMLLIVIGQGILFGPLWRMHGSRRVTMFSGLAALVLVSLLFVPQAQGLVTQLVLSGEKVWYYGPLEVFFSKLGLTVSSSQLHTIFGLVGVIVLAAVGVIVFKLWGRFQRVRVGPGLVVAATLVYLLILVASGIPRGMGLKRQALILFPYVLGGLAAIFSSHRRRLLLLAALAVVTLPVSGYAVLLQEQQDWRGAVRWVEQRAGSGDVIAINAAYMQAPFNYYYRGDVPRKGVTPESLTDELPGLTSSYERSWLVLSGDRYTDPQGSVQRWFDENCRLIEERTFVGVRVRLYGTP